MAYNFVQSKKGRDKLVYNGYVYRFVGIFPIKNYFTLDIEPLSQSEHGV